jgi:hypothetical protein
MNCDLVQQIATLIERTFRGRTEISTAEACTLCAQAAKLIFGGCGNARVRGMNMQVGFSSYYGFHPRGEAATVADAIALAVRGRRPDDPSPQDQSWVPSSAKTPHEPYIKPKPAEQPKSLFAEAA